MGLIVDTTLLINEERLARSAVDFAENLLSGYVRDEVPALSVISLVELARGRVKGETPLNHDRRQRFIAHLRETFEIVQFTADMAIRAGLLSAELSARGVTIGLADTFIAATALDLGYGVLTHNVRHFKEVPGLRVVGAA